MNKMNKETLRMQMLAGVITEGQYKAKLEEFDMDQFSFGNSSSPKASFEDKWNDVPNANKEILKKSTGKEPVKIMASSKGANYVITKGSDGKFYRYQYTQAENPGKPMGPFSSEEEAKKLNESLNEHYIAGGIVGVGAINNPFEGRKKEKYEDAFEYFLNSKYTINEEIDEEQVEEEESFEDVSLDEGDGSGGTTVGELLGMLNSINPNAEISLNYDGDEGTEVTALNSVDTEGLGFDEPEIILVGETTEDHMTVGELKSELSKMDPSTYVTLNLDLDSGTVVVNNIEVDSEMANDEERPEIILFGS